MDYLKYIEQNTLRCEAGYRGGGIEIDLADLLNAGRTDKYDEYCMTAYQNYLGGGLLGRICNSYNFRVDELPASKQVVISEISEALNRYFHNLTNHDDDEWESETYEQNQLRKPESAY